MLASQYAITKKKSNLIQNSQVVKKVYGCCYEQRCEIQGGSQEMVG